MRCHAKRNARWILDLAAFVLSFTIGGAAAALTISHSGNADPTTEGWTQNGAAVSGIAIGPITGDVGGFDAWGVDDASTGFGLDYRLSVGGPDDAQAIALGWSFSANLRIVDPDDVPDNAGTVAYRSSTLGRSFRLIFGSESDGDPIVEAVTTADAVDPVGIPFILDGAGSTYNEYQVVFDPLSQTADVFVNGIERISDWAGAPEAAASLVVFGAPSAPGVGDVNYNSVSFATVPEPSSLTLIGFGVLLGLAIRRSGATRR